MSKAYLRYNREGVLGQVYSSTNIEFDPEGKICFVGANDEVLAINVLEGKILGRMTGPEDFHAQVTRLVCGRSRSVLAVGYSDGSVLIFDPSTYKMVQRFAFHSASVTALTFDDAVFLVAHPAIGVRALQRQQGHHHYRLRPHCFL